MDEKQLKLCRQVEATKREMWRCRPRSKRHIELELRLRDLVARQLRLEIRIKRQRAA
jgi:hypothetical protein